MQVDKVNSYDTNTIDSNKAKTKINQPSSLFSEEQLESWSGHIPAFLANQEK